MRQAWKNWSGSLRFTPTSIATPGSEEELAELVSRAAEMGRAVRPVGAGHSSSPLVATEDVLVSLERFRSVVVNGEKSREATIGTGLTLKEAGRALGKEGLAFSNLGDVDVQTVAGAMATGTHGTGTQLTNLATHLIGGRLVTGTGEVSEFGAEGDDPPVQAARVSLGAVGIMTAMRLRLQPAYQLRKREWCSHIDDCLENFEELAARHRHIDFYWYPRRDEAKIRIMDLAEDEPDMLSFARLVAEEVGWSNEIIANVRELRFEEMEYALPAAAGPACFAEVRGRVKERHRQRVAWRVLYRTVAPDDAFLSPHYDRQSVTISLHHNAGLPYWDYFGDIEPIFRAHGGRPHWGKKHTLTAAELRPLYPAWGDFSAVRRRMDPCGVFMTPAMRDLLGIS